MICPHCHCDDPRMIEDVTTGPKDPKHPQRRVYFCGNCSKTFKVEV
jgi:hypothetical protein